jgi:hypothetical protein
MASSHGRAYALVRAWRDIAISDLKQYVTEELNPENKKGVDGAETHVPSPPFKQPSVDWKSWSAKFRRWFDRLADASGGEQEARYGTVSFQ